QHHQVAVQGLGESNPDVDVEVIALGADYLAALGLRRWRLVINTMDNPSDTAAYARPLTEWRPDRAAGLPDADQEKDENHPMRVLDSKRPETQEVVADAPRIADVLDQGSRDHFARVQEGLRALGIPFEIDVRLVRGLDYYTHTLFEF